MRWFDLMPNSASSGSTKVLNMSSTRPLAAGPSTTAEHLGVDQGGEDDRPLALALGGVVDLAHHLVRLVGRVDEGPPHVARLDRELRQDRVAEGLGGDAGAVGDEEDGARVHAVHRPERVEVPTLQWRQPRRMRPQSLAHPAADALRPARRSKLEPGSVCAGRTARSSPGFQHHGAFPCLHLASRRPPWSYRLKT